MEALEYLQTPARHDELATYVRTFDEGRELPPLEEILAAEQEIAAREGRVVLCPALDGSSGRQAPDYLARSDWTIADRIVALDATSRGLWFLRVFADFYLIAREDRLTNVSPLEGYLRALMAQVSAESPVIQKALRAKLTRSTAERLRDAAEDALERYGDAEREDRGRIAQSLGLDDLTTLQYFEIGQ